MFATPWPTVPVALRSTLALTRAWFCEPVRHHQTLANTRKSQEKWERRKAQIEAERAGAEVPLTDEERKREKARREKLRARAMRADFKAYVAL